MDAATHEPAVLPMASSESGAHVVADVEAGRARQRLLEHVHAEPSVSVVGLPTDRSHPAHHFALDLAMGSRYPGLVVPRVI